MAPAQVQRGGAFATTLPPEDHSSSEPLRDPGRDWQPLQVPDFEADLAWLPLAPELTSLEPLAQLGYQEVLRIAASLAWYLPDAFARAIVDAAQAAAIRPAGIGGPHLWVPEQGIMARLENRMVALGRVAFLSRLGMAPSPPELHVARRLEDRGSVSFFVMVVREQRCLGILGIKGGGASGRGDERGRAASLASTTIDRDLLRHVAAPA